VNAAAGGGTGLAKSQAFLGMAAYKITLIVTHPTIRVFFFYPNKSQSDKRGQYLVHKIQFILEEIIFTFERRISLI
jgi:hypothetical protein